MSIAIEIVKNGQISVYGAIFYEKKDAEFKNYQPKDLSIKWINN